MWVALYIVWRRCSYSTYMKATELLKTNKLKIFLNQVNGPKRNWSSRSCGKKIIRILFRTISLSEYNNMHVFYAAPRGNNPKTHSKDFIYSMHVASYIDDKFYIRVCGRS